MKYDQLIVQPGGKGVIALFNGEVVAVILNRRRVDLAQKPLEKKLIVSPEGPVTRRVVESSRQFTYITYEGDP